MLTHILILSLSLTFPGLQNAQSQTWSKYIPKGQRKDIMKRCIKATGMGAAMSGQIGVSTWVTEPMARALVSEAFDRERLTSEEADAKYREFRPGGGYVFLINAIRIAGVSPFMGGMSAKNLPDPLAARESFLQREDDRKCFSKGEVADHQFDVNYGDFFRGSTIVSKYVVIFGREDRAGSPVVRDLGDKIEVQFTLSGKKVVLDYKIKDLVKELSEL